MIQTDKMDFCETNILIFKMSSGYAVAKLVETLRYKPGGRGFDSR